MAEDNLRIGRTVVTDSVNPIELTRIAWSDAAARAGQTIVEVEVVCSDPIEHRKRVESRAADIADMTLPTWRDVVDRDYRPWHRDRIIIDTARKSVEHCVDELLARLPSAPD